MRIDDIKLSRSLLHVRAWVLTVEVNGDKFTGYFEENLGSFLAAVREMGAYFAVRAGKVKPEDSGLTRPVKPR